jgi:hypothetical protein
MTNLMSMNVQLKFSPTNQAERKAAFAAVQAVENSIRDSLAVAGQAPTATFSVNEATTRQVLPSLVDFSRTEITVNYGVHINDTPAPVETTVRVDDATPAPAE